MMNKSILPLILSFAAMAASLSGCSSIPAHEPIAPVGAGYGIPEDFRIVGYFPSWSGDPDRIQYRALSHLNFAFMAPTMEGGYQQVVGPEKLARLTAFAHSYGVGVLASVGGWSDDGTNVFNVIAADPALTAQFVEATNELMERFSLDGIDIDWEYPRSAEADNFARFIHALAESLHAQGKILSIAVSADSANGRNIKTEVIADTDFINIMAYDDGLGTPQYVHHSTFAFAEKSMDYWLLDREVPASKATLGLPFYGRSLTTRKAYTFRSIVDRDQAAPYKDVSRGIGYNGFETIRAKTVLLGRARGGGVMIWQLNQDGEGADSLLNAIFDAIKTPLEERESANPG
jgi:chitinase